MRKWLTTVAANSYNVRARQKSRVKRLTNDVPYLYLPLLALSVGLVGSLLFSAAAAASTNVALNRPATASTSTGAFAANKAVDGKTISRWTSESADDQWFQIDLGVAYTIDRVVLNWDKAGKDYDIAVSNSASGPWTVIKSVTGNTTNGVKDYTGLSGTGRYVKLILKTRATSNGFSLWEVEVYGSFWIPDPEPAPNPPDPAIATVNDNAITYSTGWLTSTAVGKYKNDDHNSITCDASATYTFTGTQIEIFGAKDAQNGIATVSIDNGPEYLFDAHSPFRMDGSLLYSSYQLTNEPHTLKVRVTCLKNAAASNVTVALDKLVIHGPASPPPPPPLATATGKFYIAGRNIIDPDGYIFFPVGANVGIRIKGADVYGNWTSQGGSATGHVNDAKAWDWNIIRATLWCTPNNVSNNYATLPELLQATDDIINEYTAQKIVVMLECHDLYGANILNTNDSRFTPIHQFFEATVQRYQNNPYVWFNYMNEPLTKSINDDANNTKWVTYQTDLYNRIRSTGAENIFVADLPNWAADIYSAQTSDYATAFSSLTCNLLYSFHSYGFNWVSYPSRGDLIKAYNAYTSAYANAYNKNMPLITGEIGYDWNSVSKRDAVGYWTYPWNRAAAMAAFDTAAQYGYGVLWWHGTHAFLSTKNSDSQTFYMPTPSANLSEGGQRLWDLGHNKPPLQPFTGNLADSHCASAQ